MHGFNVRQERRESPPVVLIALASREIRGADVGLQTAPARDVRLGAAPRPRRVRRLLAGRCGGALG
jgi:hypothetical protein